MRTGDMPLAESAFAKAQALAPRILEYGLHRVDAACAANTKEELLAWLESESEVDPLNAVLPAMRGELLEHLGRRSEAIDAMEAAVALAPSTLELLRSLGGLLARANRLP